MTALAVALPAVLLAGSAAAQSFPDRNANAGYAPFTGGTQLQCGTTATIVAGAGQTAYACSGQGADYTGLAQVEDGAVRVRSAVSAGSLTATMTQAIWGAAGQATWRDRLLFGGADVSSLDVALSWTGNVSSAVTGTSGAAVDASASYGFMARGATGDLAYYTNFVDAYSRWDTGLTHDVAVNDTQIFHVALGGLSYVDFQYWILASSSLDSFVSTAGSTFGGHADADFTHTAKLVGLIFRDAAGNDVSATTTYSFVNGAQVFASDVTTTPEPASLLLLASGLSGVLLLRRRTNPRRPRIA